MRLALNSCASYLRKLALLSVDSIVDGDLVITDASSRNLNLKVVCKRHPSYLIKQSASNNPTDVETLRREAAFYGLIFNDPELVSFSAYLPKYHHFDSENNILIIDLLSESENLTQYHKRIDKFPIEVGTLLGEVLANLHSITPTKLMNNCRFSSFKSTPPWTLYIHEPRPDLFENVSVANLHLIKIIQQHQEFAVALKSLRADWKDRAVIHGDIKWSNYLVKTSDQRFTSLKLIDWECVTIGDSAWDIGSVFNDYLAFWILSMPVTGRDPPERFLELTRYPLESLQPAIRSFWKAYTDEFGLHGVEANDLLLRAIKYCAIRLIQTGYERMQMSRRLTGNVICLLQVALNILRRPEDAIKYLLNL